MGISTREAPVGLAGRDRPAGHGPAPGRASRLWAVAFIALGLVLRFWGLRRPQLNFDETFTAVAARLPPRALFAFLRSNDSHPPLDYLMRHPFAVAGANETWLRLPSAVLSAAALVCTWRWWRPYGRVGLAGLALLAVAPFQITYAHDARAYAGLGLVGVVIAWSATRWLEGCSVWRWGAIAGLALGAGLFLQAGTLLLAPCVVVVAGLRRDRDAWAWRGCAAAPLLVWAVLWGRSFLEQAGGHHAQWIPLASWHYATMVVNELVDNVPALSLVVVGAIAIGTTLIPVGPLRRVWWTLGAAPVGLTILLGTSLHVLLPRTVAFADWAPLFALAALADGAARRSAPLGIGVAALCLLVLAPSTAKVLTLSPPPEQAVMLHLRAVVAPGDAVTTQPAFLQPLATWYLGDEWLPHGRVVQLTGLDQPRGVSRQGVVVDGAPRSGRTWILVEDQFPDPAPGWSVCAPTAKVGVFHVLCFWEPDVGRSGAGR